jgi:hypothetical protein
MLLSSYVNLDEITIKTIKMINEFLFISLYVICYCVILDDVDVKLVLYESESDDV